MDLCGTNLMCRVAVATPVGPGCKIHPSAVGGIVVSQEIGKQLGVRSIFAERKEGKMQLRRGFSLGKDDCVLVVEDVVTSGGSVKEVVELAEAAIGAQKNYMLNI